ncbi:MAG: hypothetical protein ACHQPH_04070 [Reyranellales bacterium]|jgi:hypothetical protein
MQARKLAYPVRIGATVSLCLFISPGAFGAEGGFCWVSGVEKTATGVTVYLSQPQRVFVTRPNGGGGPYVTDSNGRAALAGVVSAALGDKLSFDTSAHSSCYVDVVIKDEKIGANVYGAIAAPGAGIGRTGTEFIAAQ